MRRKMGLCAFAFALLFVPSVHSQDQKPAETPSPAAPQPMRIRIAGKVQKPKLKRQVQPVYPQRAVSDGITGTVVLRIVVGTDGTVRAIQYVSGPKLLMRSAMEAVKEWQYEPTLLNGQAVEVDTTVDVVFALPHSG